MTYAEHPHFPPAPIGMKVWRYLTYTRFIWLLEEKALFFTRVEHLGDKYEGSLTKATILKVNKFYNPVELDGYYQMRSAGHLDILINCWHMNEHESAAMWGNYGNGIAIQSSVERLRDSVLSPAGENFWLVPIQYLDYQSEDEINIIALNSSLYPYMCKRKSFEHERELRAIIAVVHDAMPERGRTVPINPTNLIEKIYLAPGYDASFLNTVQFLVNKKYQLDIPVEHCAYDADPLYNNLW
jgi:hypothetical protein